MARKWLQSVDVETDEAGKPSFESALEALAACIEDGRLKVSMADELAYCRVRQATSGCPPDPAGRVKLNTVDEDTESGWDTTNKDRYTVQVAGLYHLSGWTARENAGFLKVRVNGTEVAAAYDAGGGGQPASVSCIVRCSANDVIDLYHTGEGTTTGLSDPIDNCGMTLTRVGS
jgi:hypothetical protein